MGLDLPAWLTRQDPTLGDPEARRDHLDGFRICLLAHVVVQAWAWLLQPPPFPFGFPGGLIIPAALALSGAFVLALVRSTRLACTVAAPIVLLEVAWLFPGTPNHVYLSAVLMVVMAVFDTRREEESLLAFGVLRWIAVTIFVWAGLQKALHGLYFQGEFLTWMISHGVDRWELLFGPMLPADELERVTSYPRYIGGTGPYRVDSPVMLILSNGVWIGEILVGLGMALPRFRSVAAIAGILIVFAIQAAPREFMFAFLYTNLLLLLLPGNLNRRLQWLFVALYGLMLLGVLGVPVDFLMKAGGGL